MDPSGNPGLCRAGDWIKEANRALTDAKKDNDFIYHERIPEVKNLSSIGRAPVVKPKAVPEKFLPDEKELFGALMPVHIHQALAAYEVRKQELVSKEVGRLKEGTSTLNDILISMNLPAALEDTTGGGVPPSLLEKSGAVVEAGGVQELNRLAKELPELLQRNTDLLTEAERMLEEEEKSDSSLRSQHGAKWNRTASATLTTTFKTNLTKYKTILDNAVTADGVVREKMTTHQAGMAALSGGENSLLAFIPSGSSAAGGGSSAPRLKQLMEDVETLRAERSVIESELKNTNPDMKTIFLQAAANGTLNEPLLSTQSLERAFGGLQQQVRSSNIWSIEID